MQDSGDCRQSGLEDSAGAGLERVPFQEASPRSRTQAASQGGIAGQALQGADERFDIAGWNDRREIVAIQYVAYAGKVGNDRWKTRSHIFDQLEGAGDSGAFDPAGILHRKPVRRRRDIEPAEKGAELILRDAASGRDGARA